MHVVNVLTRILVLIVGIGVACGLGPASQSPSPFREVFGTVVILFAAFRLITYYSARNRSEE